MFVFSYTGKGWVVLAFGLAVLFFGLIFFKDFKRDSPLYLSPWPEVILAGINIVACGILGWWMNRGRPRKIVYFNMHRITGHTFYFVSVEYCGVFSVLFYGFFLLKGGVFH